MRVTRVAKTTAGAGNAASARGMAAHRTAVRVPLKAAPPASTRTAPKTARAVTPTRAGVAGPATNNSRPAKATVLPPPVRAQLQPLPPIQYAQGMGPINGPITTGALGGGVAPMSGPVPQPVLRQLGKAGASRLLALHSAAKGSRKGR